MSSINDISPNKKLTVDENKIAEEMDSPLFQALLEAEAEQDRIGTDVLLLNNDASLKGQVSINIKRLF